MQIANTLTFNSDTYQTSEDTSLTSQTNSKNSNANCVIFVKDIITKNKDNTKTHMEIPWQRINYSEYN